MLFDGSIKLSRRVCSLKFSFEWNNGFRRSLSKTNLQPFCENVLGVHYHVKEHFTKRTTRHEKFKDKNLHAFKWKKNPQNCVEATQYKNGKKKFSGRIVVK